MCVVRQHHLGKGDAALSRCIPLAESNLDSEDIASPSTLALPVELRSLSVQLHGRSVSVLSSDVVSIANEIPIAFVECDLGFFCLNNGFGGG